MRVLALKWRRLGDTVLWTSALEALREWQSDLELDIAVPEGYAPLFADDPRVTRIVPLTRGAERSWATLRDLRDRRYDWALGFHASARTLTLALGCGARHRLVHHHSRRPRNYFSQRRILDLGKVMPARDCDLNVVRTLGWSGPPPPTKLYVGAERRARGLERLAAEGLLPHEKPLLLMGPFASREAKQWPLERYAELACAFAGEFHVAVLYDTEKGFAGKQRLRAALARHARLVATPKLEDLLGIVPHASLFVGSDSGLKHLACALDVPTVTLFGPESVGEWHFYPTERHRIVRRNVACRTNDPEPAGFEWCGEDVCPLASHACLLPIEAREVENVVRQLLAVTR